MKRCVFAAIAGLLLLAGPTAAESLERVLANGMKVVVKTDCRAPVVVSQVWYRAGSMDESYGSTGVAHVLEHMMFKGTESVPAGEFSKRIAAAGGRENAFTSRDHTAYFQTLQKDRLELAFQLEADRMANLLLAPEEFAKEINVVMEERRMAHRGQLPGPALREADGDRLPDPPLPPPGDRLDGRPPADDGGGCAPLVRDLVCPQQRQPGGGRRRRSGTGHGPGGEVLLSA